MLEGFKLSIVIPVYKSAGILPKTIELTVDEMRNTVASFEIILVDDGSPDGSWQVVQDLAARYAEVFGYRLLRNYGQHTAVFCGIKMATGDYVVTMDDDLQNPPDQIVHLIRKIREGYDLVFGEFPVKQHGAIRKQGTRLVGYLNSQIFGKPKGIKLTNFRIFTREVASRLVNHRTNYPYIPGLLLLYARRIANVPTNHQPRLQGKSNYSMWKILALMARLIFNYSSYPLKVMSGLGFVISLISFGAGCFYMLKSIFIGTEVQGWTTVVVLLSFIGGSIIVMLGIVGEYLGRMMNQLSIIEPFHIIASTNEGQ